MKLIQIDEFIRYLKTDGVYGNAFISQKIIKHELRLLKINAFFVKGLKKYVVDNDDKQVPFLKFCFEYDDFEIQKEKLEELSEQQNLLQEKEAFEYLSEKKKEVNHTENLILLMFYVGLESVDRQGNKIRCFEKKKEKSGANQLLKYDLNFYVEMDKLKDFLFSQKLPLPNSLFLNESNTSSNAFLTSLKEGPWRQEFSVELLQDFVTKNLPENYQKQVDKYHFYKDGEQFCIAFGKERAKVKSSKGLRAIHVVLKNFMDATKDHKFMKSIKGTEIERQAGDSQIEENTVDYNTKTIDDNGLKKKNGSFPKFDYDNIKSTKNIIQKKKEELQKAKTDKDEKKIERISNEIKKLQKYLNQNTRPGWKEKIDSPEQKACDRVMRNIRDTAKKNMVEKYSLPLLACHLKSIHEKKGIIYEPDTNARYDWILEPPENSD